MSTNDTLQEVFRESWYAYLLLPLLVALITGTLQAAMIGIYLARKIAFDTARLNVCRSINQLINLPYAHHATEAETIAGNILVELKVSTTEFLRLRQYEAAAYTKYISTGIGQVSWEVHPPSSYPLRPVVRDAHAEELVLYVDIFVRMIFEVRPMKYYLFTLRGYVGAKESQNLWPEGNIFEREVALRKEIENEREQQRQNAGERHDQSRALAEARIEAARTRDYRRSRPPV